MKKHKLDWSEPDDPDSPSVVRCWYRRVGRGAGISREALSEFA